TGEKFPLPTKKGFKLVFVGAAILRKGVDVLLKAYGRAFSPEEDVSLVIKDHSKDVFYSGIKLKDEILKLANDKTYPELIYIDRFLSTEELASLYRACDVGVFPYRAEGFSITILESMACGVPPIVPKFGACLDFCTSSNSLLVPVKRINVPVRRGFLINTLGFREDVEEVDFCEVSVDVLASFLREAFNMSGRELERRSREGVKTAHSNFKWSDSMAVMKKHLENLDRYKTPTRLRGKRAEMKKNRAKFEVAKELFLNR
ncbi:MAG: glycosyltransferase, partial [Thermodesulfobacteriota bacterium]